MAILSELVLYPIKSCAGMVLEEATLTRAGLWVDGIADREWMLVDPSGQFLSQREYPRMALIHPRLSRATLEVSAPGMPVLALALAHPALAHTREVRVWDDTMPASDCGDAAADWFTQAIGAPCRLVRFRPGVVRPTNTKWSGGVEAEAKFADGYPLLVIGAASLADLNDKLGAARRAALPMNRFRPNLVVDGIGPFEEDYTESFQIGAAEIKPVKPCARCPIPSVDQATGVPGPDPLDILQTYRGKPQLDGAPCFGMNAVVTKGEGTRLRVGQEVLVTLAF